jgi:rhamnogalacturonyl hydrolase YesR
MRAMAVFLSVLGLMAASDAGPSTGRILSISERVADWQLAHMGQMQPGTRPETYEPRGWVEGAFYVGLTALADQTAKPAYDEAILAHGTEQQWQLGPRPFHADDHVIGQTWIWAYEHLLDPKMIAPVRAGFDAVIAAAPHGSLAFSEPGPGVEAGCQDRWCWCDALFMGPPGWFELSRATGDSRYAAYADKEYWATVDKLFSPQDDLFYRDTRFIGQKGPHGEKIFWARGNGWVYAGLARIIQFLPPDAPERPRYIDLFRKMSAKLISLQKPDGTWPVSLEGPAEGTPPETSGTGFFTFGLAYGVASGILSEPKYRAAAERGWSALVRAVGPDGRLGWVQPIGAAPDAVTQADTQLYGVGAFLLAGSAMMDLEQRAKPVALTLHNPLAMARTAARVEIPPGIVPYKADWVAVLGDQVAPLQPTKSGAITVLDIPAKATLKLVLRRRFGFDPPARRYADAAIPVKEGDGYHEVQNFAVPPTHTIHDPLLPFEGAGWESDRIAYRVYLDKRFATDIYGKKLPGPILHFIGRGGPSYHDENNAWGRDMWTVGDSLGAGGVGVLHNGMATQVGDMKAMKATVVADGPVLAGVRVDCTGISIDGKAKNLVTDFTISAGSRLSVDTASAPGVPLVAGFGKWPNTTIIASPKETRGWAYVATWGRQSDDGKDDVGVALFYPVAEMARTGDDGRSLYVVFRNPAKARWAFAGAWAREGGGIADEASFRAYLETAAAELSHPVTVTK